MDWFNTASAGRRAMILWDEGMYPVARWGIERAEARGAIARSFAHFAPAALAREIVSAVRRRLRPVIVSDGYCIGCGRPAPLRAYSELSRRTGGLLVVDDTQAIGLFGADDMHVPGGGGSLQKAGLDCAGVVWVASLAKAFGAPIAALAGEEAIVARFEAESETRVHASPPNAAAIAAAARALAKNEMEGAARRRCLAARVRCFRAALARAGLSATGGAHPVQLIDPISGVAPSALHASLMRSGVHAVLLRPRCRPAATLAFVITVAHEEAQVDRAVRVLADAVSGQRAATTTRRGARGDTSCSSLPS